MYLQGKTVRNPYRRLRDPGDLIVEGHHAVQMDPSTVENPSVSVCKNRVRFEEDLTDIEEHKTYNESGSRICPEYPGVHTRSAPIKSALKKRPASLGSAHSTRNTGGIIKKSETNIQLFEEQCHPKSASYHEQRSTSTGHDSICSGNSNPHHGYSSHGLQREYHSPNTIINGQKKNKKHSDERQPRPNTLLYLVNNTQRR